MQAVKAGFRQPLTRGSYPPIADYALISDCASTALVGRNGSIDWCCMPQMDSESCFGRLLDWKQGGHCSIAPAKPEDASSERAYEDDSMLLATRFHTSGGSVLLHDFFAMRGEPGCHEASDHLVRVATCDEGSVTMRVEVVPRFDFGSILPDLRQVGPQLYTACGSNKGLLIWCNQTLEADADEARLTGEVTLHQGQTVQLSIRFVPPELLDEEVAAWDDEWADLSGRRDRTLAWWAAWLNGQSKPTAIGDPLTLRSALVIKALCFERTGAVIAAATTSLPEAPGGERNWDYRFSWIRDSMLAVRALHALGFEREAGRFRGFIERSAAGNARQLQLMYGIDGRRRLTEVRLDHLEGWRQARPVRIGNAATGQSQLDIYGSLLELAWLWHDKAHPFDEPYWDFLVHAVNTTCDRWRERDHGIWEVRDMPQHFVHSKLMCWVAVDRGIRLAERHGGAAPMNRWKETLARMRAEIDSEGYDQELGVYRQAYGATHADAALLLMSHFGYIDHDDPRMVRTTDWVRERLDRNGLLLRYDQPDGLPEPEGAFLPCTFWLVESLAGQGRRREARASYDRACECANELGLFSEEFARDGSGMLGNFPQAFTHLAQITARLALDALEQTSGHA